MAFLTIDNQVTATNTPTSTLNVSTLPNQSISIVTVTGPQGQPGIRGPAGTGEAVAAGVSSLNGLTGSLLIGAAGGGTSISGATVYISGYVPTVTQINGRALTGNVTILSSDIPVDHLPGATYSTLQQFLNTMNSPGLIQGAVMTDGGSGNLHISAGTGMLRIADDNISSLAFVNVQPAIISIPADIIQYYVGFVYNAGSPVFELRALNNWDNDTEIALGTVVNYFGTLVTTNNPFLVGDPITNIIQRFDAMAPVTRDALVGGIILGELAGRYITLSAGKLWTRLNDYEIIARNTSAADTMYGASFNGLYWDYQTPLVQWPNTQYNDPAMGLATLPDGYYANLWFYCGVENGALGFIYGQAQWGNLSDASAEQAPALLPANYTTTNVLVARLTFLKGASTAAIISSAFANTFTTAPISLHNTLGGLQGGDTSQYYHLAAQDYGAITGLAARLNVSGYLALASSLSGANLNIGRGGVLGATAFTGVSGVNGLTGAVYIGATRGISTSASGQMVYISGQDWATSGNLTDSGAALGTQINSLSGFTLGASGALQSLIVGGAGTQVRVSGSSTLAIASFTGSAGVGLWVSGSTVYVSGEVTQVKLDTLSGYANSTFATKGSLDLLSGNVIQTGVQLMARDVTVSGALDSKIATTGSQVYTILTGLSGQASINYVTVITTTAISGNLIQSGVQLQTIITNTGAALYGMVTGASGLANINAVTLSGNLTQTGVVLFARDGTISGALDAKIVATGAAAVSHANGIGSIISGNLTTTGVSLYALASGISGNLGLSGQSLFARDGSISGAIDTRLGATGSVLDGRVVSLSGFTLNASGALQALIAGANGTQVKVSGSSTLLIADFSGIGSTIVYLSGGQVFISGSTASVGVTQGQLDSLSGYSNATFATKANLDLVSGLIISSSGGLEVRITASGNSAVSQANGIGAAISGNLTQSGVQLQSIVTNSGAALYTMLTGSSGLANGASAAISGALTQTGVQLINRDAAISGGLEVRITASGNSAVAQANSIGQTLSGNLTTTGLAIGLVSGGLEVRITATGQSALAHVNSVGGTLSGNATQTGVQLQGLITNTGATLYGMIIGSSGMASSSAATISGNLTQTGIAIGLVSGALATKLADTGAALIARDLSISGALQALIAGGGSVVKISGSAALATADFTGIGGTIVFSSGGQVFISGAAGGAGGGVPSVNGITSAVTIAGTGGFQVNTVGAIIVVSGLPFAGEGQLLFDNKDIISGDANLTWNAAAPTLTIGLSAQSIAITPAFISGNSGQLSFSGIANNPIAAMYTSGWGNTLYGPALYSRRIKAILPATTTSQTLFADTASNVGTLATLNTETLGEVTTYAPAAGLSAGTSFAVANAFRGTGPGVGNGFFFITKFLLNSNWASGLNIGTYGAPSGCRIFAGMTDQAVATQTQLNDPIGNFVGLQYLWASGGAVGTGQYMQNWAVTSRNNTSTSTGNAGMVFQTGLYRFGLYCPPHPNNNIIYYQLDDILRGSGVKGQITSTLPVGSTAMRGLVAIGFVSGAKNIGTSVLYSETPNSSNIG